MKEQSAPEKSDISIIVTTAGKAAYVAVVAIAFILALIYTFFPLPVAKLHASINNYDSALRISQRAERITSGENKVNAIIDQITYAAHLYDNDANYADELLSVTEKYLASQDCVDRAVLIDEYNIANSPKSFHANLYSYVSYVNALNAKAAASLGKSECINVDGIYCSIDSALLLAVNDFSLSIALNQIAAAVEVDRYLHLSPYVVSSALNELGVVVLGETDALRQLYLAKSIEKVYTRLTQYGYELTVNIGGSNPTELYYEVLLPNYIK